MALPFLSRSLPEWCIKKLAKCESFWPRSFSICILIYGEYLRAALSLFRWLWVLRAAHPSVAKRNGVKTTNICYFYWYRSVTALLPGWVIWKCVQIVHVNLPHQCRSTACKDCKLPAHLKTIQTNWQPPRKAMYVYPMPNVLSALLYEL